MVSGLARQKSNGLDLDTEVLSQMPLLPVRHLLRMEGKQKGDGFHLLLRLNLLIVF